MTVERSEGRQLLDKTKFEIHTERKNPIMMMYMLFPDAKRKALTFSYDDGVEHDARLMEIFNRHGLKGTFNLNGQPLETAEYTWPEGTIHRRMGYKMALETYGGELGKNHEIAIHSYTHPFLDRIPRPIANYEVAKDREVLEKLFDRLIRGCAYPMGTFNDMTVDVLRDNGIAYARTTVSTGNFSIPTDWLRMPATCHHNDARLFDLAETFVGGASGAWDTPWLFYVWGHAYEFDADNNWDRIESFCEKVGGHDDVWYATNMEIYDYVEAYRALHFSVEGKFVHNPSAIPVWFEYAGVTCKVEPGETKRFR